jgi:hypothetical protein
VTEIKDERLSYSLKDYESARKKALAVGAKKFFLEVFPGSSMFAVDALTGRPAGS